MVAPINLKFINRLIKDILHNPFDGIVKPGPLKKNLTDLWSRQIDYEYRIVYIVESDNIIILSCRRYYN